MQDEQVNNLVVVEERQPGRDTETRRYHKGSGEMTKELFVKDIMAKPTTISKSAKITEALDKMLDLGIDPLIALNNTSVVGTVSRQAIAEKLGSKQNTAIAPTAIHVASVVEEDFTSVYPDESVNVLIPLLQRYKLVVVYDSDHKLLGQVTAIDLLKKYPHTGALKEAMVKAVTIEADERVVHLRRRMLDDAISRFVVTENSKPVGIVTETDVAVSMRKFREAGKGPAPGSPDPEPARQGYHELAAPVGGSRCRSTRV